MEELKYINTGYRNRFKIGDKIRLNGSQYVYIVIGVADGRYRVTSDYLDLYIIDCNRQDAYILIQ